MNEEDYGVALDEMTGLHLPKLKDALDWWESAALSHNELLEKVKIFQSQLEALIRVDPDHGTDPWR